MVEGEIKQPQEMAEVQKLESVMGKVKVGQVVMEVVLEEVLEMMDLQFANQHQV